MLLDAGLPDFNSSECNRHLNLLEEERKSASVFLHDDGRIFIS